MIIIEVVCLQTHSIWIYFHVLEQMAVSKSYRRAQIAIFSVDNDLRLCEEGIEKSNRNGVAFDLDTRMDGIGIVISCME